MVSLSCEASANPTVPPFTISMAKEGPERTDILSVFKFSFTMS